MKLILIILAVVAALIAALCLIRLKLRITYRDTLKLELYAGPVCLNKLLDGSIRGKKKKKSGRKKADDSENAPEKEKKPITDSLGEILQILKEFTTRFLGHVSVKCARIVIAVGSDDPAKTAVRYGAVVQSVAYITELLKRNTKFSLKRDAVASVYPDFTAERSRAEIDITLALSVGGALHALLAAARAYIFK